MAATLRLVTFKLSNDANFETKLVDVVVLDNYAVHKHPAVAEWVAKPRYKRWHLHFTPTSSSWLNLVERWADHWNEDPRPFIWHRSAEEIIAKRPGPGHPLLGTADALPAQPGVDPRRPVGALGAGVDGLDPRRQLCVVEGSTTGDVLALLVVGGTGNLEQ